MSPPITRLHENVISALSAHWQEEVQLSPSSRRWRWPHLPCQQVFAFDIMAFTRVINTLYCCPRWSSPRRRSCHHDFPSLLFSESISVPFLFPFHRETQWAWTRSRCAKKGAGRHGGELSARWCRYGYRRWCQKERLCSVDGTEMCLIALCVGQLMR